MSFVLVPGFQGNWSSNIQYGVTLLQNPVEPLSYLASLVNYNDTLYIANYINHQQPTKGTAPDVSAQWSLFTSGGGSGGSNFQGYWQANGNSPTLANGTGAAGFFYINTSSGTNSVNFGAGAISFAQNDIVEYSSGGEWYNAGQVPGVANIISSNPGLLTAVNSDGTVTLSIVNANQIASTTNSFDVTLTDVNVIGNVTLDVSTMVMNRLYYVLADGGMATINLTNGTFKNSNTSTQTTIQQTNTIILKRVGASLVKIY